MNSTDITVCTEGFQELCLYSFKKRNLVEVHVGGLVTHVTRLVFFFFFLLMFQGKTFQVVNKPDDVG